MPEKKLSAADKVLQQLNSPAMVKAIQAVLPAFMSKDRFMQMAMSVAKMQANSKYVVNKNSILQCVYTAAKFGLELNDALGHAYLVPFKKTCTLIVGYKGLLELVRRSNQVSDIYAFVVYQKDEFEYYVDENGPHIKYKPHRGKDRGKPTECVSIARFKDVGMMPSIDVMPYDRVEAIKSAALARTPKSPWGNPLYEPEMAKKTVLRHHCKTLPMSTEVAHIVEMDEKVERDEMPDLLELPEELKQDDNVVDGEFEDVQTEQPAEQEQPADPARTGRQEYNVMAAKVMKKMGSEAGKEAVDEVVAKVFENSPLTPADISNDDPIWKDINKNLEALI